MRLAQLRKQLPSFIWRSERRGFGYTYVGINAFGQRVTVFAEARLCGPTEDDFATVWVVDDGQSRKDFSRFLLENLP